MKKIFILFSILSIGLLHPACTNQNENNQYLRISSDELLDKIKGGWAGQVIGCTYGGPTEFRYQGKMIPADTLIPWDSSRMLWYFENAPGLYDDVYMDLTFVEVFEREGLDAPALSHAKAFAEAAYMLWHANQAARYNILQGMTPPASGYWENNPHADDIDFQIEADFAGLMSPGMLKSSSLICDRIGHIMNYGDGWYGGVFVAALYALAFTSSDMEFLVSEALKTIPEESRFYQCIQDIVNWYGAYPDDWTKTWEACETKWATDIGCPDGVFRPFNIDAKINAAYIVIGLLYGQGDYGKTLDISTRCGQDSDCNPANAAGILGTALGYSAIPDYWKQGLQQVENIDFKYTNISLNKVYEMGYRQAVQNILRNGGSETREGFRIRVQPAEKQRLEQSFVNHYPIELRDIAPDQQILDAKKPEFTFRFEGVGFVVKGQSEGNVQSPKIAVLIDGILHEEAFLPIDFTTRRHEICWKYKLEPGPHEVNIRLLAPSEEAKIQLRSLLIYSDQPGQ